jgi:hypothetical protein
MFDRYVDLIRRVSPTVMLGYWGERLHGTLSGLMWDWAAQGASEAVLAPLLTRPQQPPDALPVIANERGLAKYIVEDDLDWQTRLLSAWDLWENGGSETLIELQLNTAGYVGAVVESPLTWGRSPVDWPSQFWIYLPQGAHNGLFSSAPIAGVAIAGQHLCGITGPSENVAELRYIAQNFRPADEVCRQIIVELDGPTCPHPTPQTCGGEQVFIGTGIVPI